MTEQNTPTQEEQTTVQENLNKDAEKVKRITKLGETILIPQEDIAVYDAEEAKIVDVKMELSDETPRCKCKVTLDNGVEMNIDSSFLEKTWEKSQDENKPDYETLINNLKFYMYNEIRRALHITYLEHNELIRLLSNRNLMNYHQSEMQFQASKAKAEAEGAKTSENEATEPKEVSETQSTTETPTHA